MPEEPQDAPYAPPANVIGVIRRFRDRNLPEQIDADLLLDIGISKGNVHRTLAALRFLHLIADGGYPKPAFESLQAASESDYPRILEGIVRNAYQDVFKAGIDPGKDGHVIIDNHFRRYQPRSQRGRMMTLFLGLCREAGIPVLDAPRERGMRVNPSGTAHRQPAPSAVARSPVATPSTSVSSLRRDYIAALIEQVRQGEASQELLDRIEKLLAQEQADRHPPDIG